MASLCLVILAAPLAVRASAAATATADGPVACPASYGPRFVAVENEHAGTNAWRITSSGAPGAPEGFLNVTSARCGQTVTLYASSTEPYRVTAFRMGWYRGLLGRLVWRSEVQPAAAQPDPVRAPVTGRIDAPWSPTTTIHIDGRFVPGSYLFELTSAAGSSYVPLTVRTDHATPVLMVDAVNTWQMYNGWGGESAYHAFDGDPAGMSHEVSFDRPYDHGGADAFVRDDLPATAALERTLPSVSYVTDMDLDRGTALLPAAKVVVFGSHSEYWTSGMRAHLLEAMRSGVNVAFLGANNMYWRPRPDVDPEHVATTDPYRVLDMWRDTSLDPVRTREGISTRWRIAPIGLPEQDVLGAQYGCTPVDRGLTVTSTSSWLFRGLPLHTTLHHYWYGEVDTPMSDAPLPRLRRVVVSTPAFRCPDGGQVMSATSTFVRTSGGGLLFDAGTEGLLLPLVDPAVRIGPDDAYARRRIVTNLVTAMATGPIGALIGR